VRIALLGLGLIGGSLARAVRPYGWPVAAWTPAGEGPRRAVATGVIDTAAPSVAAAVAGADLVVLAAPASACLALLEELAGPSRAALGPDAVVTDVASTKALLVERARALGLRFVGGHPLAGRETSGFGAADATLFGGRPWVVVPAPGDERATARVEMLAAACGARTVRLEAAEHDAAVAAISHAPLVLAAALVEAMAGAAGEPEAPGWPAAAALAATGWASATRLALGDPAMGAAIARTNAAPLAARLRDVQARLDAWIALLEAAGPDGLPDERALRDRLAGARDRLAAARRPGSGTDEAGGGPDAGEGTSRAGSAGW
jgi:prephenate dehydrogenase